MRALLRLQAVLAFRHATTPLWLLAGVGVAVMLAPAWLLDLDLGYANHALRILPLLIVSVAGVVLTAQTLEGLDFVRWTSPVRASQFLAAHMSFWTAAYAVPAMALASLRAGEGQPFLPLFGALVLFGATVAATAFTLHRLLRSRSTWAILLLLGPIPSAATMAAFGVLEAWMGDWVLGFSLIGIPFSVALAAGWWTSLRDEALPVAVEGASESTSNVNRRVDRVRNARIPPISILRGSWPLLIACLWVSMGVFFQVIPGASEGMSFYWNATVVVILGQAATSSWYWLLATPIDRGRAFRLLFLPLVGLAALMATTGLLMHQKGGDHFELFHHFREDKTKSRGSVKLLLGHLLREDLETQTYREPEPSYMAARISEYIRQRFDLDVPEHRVLAVILRGWPAIEPGAHLRNQEAVSDAMRRVQSDLDAELRSAVRLGSVMNAVLVFLIAMFGLRIVLTGFPRNRKWLLGIYFPVLFLSLPPDLPLYDRLPELLLQPRRILLSAVQSADAPIQVLLLLSAGCIAVLLWRSSAAAFRRLEITDLPPSMINKDIWGKRI